MAFGPQNDNPDKNRRLKSGLIRFTIMLAAILLMLGTAWLISNAIDNGNQDIPDGDSGNTVPSSSQVPSVASRPESTASEAGQDSSTGETNPDGPPPVANTDYRMIALPENGLVDMSYFETVTFIGDSLTQGLKSYSTGIQNATYCAYRGISPKSIYDGSIRKNVDGIEEIPMDAIVASQPDNVYILLGANAMVSMTDEAIISYYSEMLTHLKENLADGVGIYIQTITAVRPENEADFDMNRINGINDMLAQLSIDESVYFLDLNEVLAGEDGYLREEIAAKDGYHLNAEGYTVWKDYLATHTAYHSRNPYIEGPYAPDTESAADGQADTDGSPDE